MPFMQVDSVPDKWPLLYNNFPNLFTCFDLERPPIWSFFQCIYSWLFGPPLWFKFSIQKKEYPGSGVASSPDIDQPPIDFVQCTRCNYCKFHWEQKPSFHSLVTSCRFGIPLKEFTTCLTCHSKNVIYLITCKKCEVQYVGLTTQKIKDRINQHINHIKKNDLSTFLVTHFNNSDHDISDVKVTIIDYITDDKDSTHELSNLENYWIRTLNTMYPFGLNDNIKGIGNISRSDISSFNSTNTPYFSISQQRKVRSHGHRGSSKSRNAKQVSDVLNQLQTLSEKHIHLLYVALRALSHKILLKIRENVFHYFLRKIEYNAFNFQKIERSQPAIFLKSIQCLLNHNFISFQMVVMDQRYLHFYQLQ